MNPNKLTKSEFAYLRQIPCDLGKLADFGESGKADNVRPLSRCPNYEECFRGKEHPLQCPLKKKLKDMILIKCAECGNDYEKFLEGCPNCEMGNPLLSGIIVED